MNDYQPAEQATIGTFLDLLQRFKDADIFYKLSNPTHGAIMIEAAVPSERWEIEMHEDGRLSVEVFISQSGVEGPERLDQLFKKFSA